MSFTRGESITGFPFGLVNKNTGDPVTTGTVTIYITKDGGEQFEAATTPLHEGHGQWTTNFNQEEMNASLIGIMITHPDALPLHFTFAVDAAPSIEASTVFRGTGSTIDDSFTYYGSLFGANSYFGKRLYCNTWDNAIINDREKSLVMATRAIDKLNFAGCKFNNEQYLQFPRGDDETIPEEIEFACYEIALKFLDGTDMEQEATTIGVMSESYSGVRTTYDGDYVNEHLRAGIPSIEAWEYLKPFLRDHRLMRVSRVN